MTLVRKDTDESSAASGVLVQTLVPSYGGIKNVASNTEEQSETHHHHHCQVIIKVIDCNKETGDKIIRRFQLPQITDEETGKPSFEQLMKILSEGPRPTNNHNDDEHEHNNESNTLYYKDNEGDIVVIATTMELTDAVSQLGDSTFSSLSLYTSPPPSQMLVSTMASKAYTSVLSLVQKCFASLVFFGQKLIEFLTFLAEVASEKCHLMTEFFLSFGMSQAHHPDLEQDTTEKTYLIDTVTRIDSTDTNGDGGENDNDDDDDKLAWKQSNWMKGLLAQTPNHTNIAEATGGDDKLAWKQPDWVTKDPKKGKAIAETLSRKNISSSSPRDNVLLGPTTLTPASSSNNTESNEGGSLYPAVQDMGCRGDPVSAENSESSAVSKSLALRTISQAAANRRKANGREHPMGLRLKDQSLSKF